MVSGCLMCCGILVSEAQMRKPQVQAFADRISKVFVPNVLILAALTWITWASVAAAGAMPQPHAEAAGHEDGTMMSG